MRLMHFRIRYWLPALVMLLLSALPAQAATKTWIGGNSNWDTGTNWSLTGEPVAADTANIGNGFGPTVSSTGNAVNTLHVGAGGIGTLNFTGVGAISVSNLTVIGQQLGQTGTITMGSTGTFSNNTLNIGVLGTGAVVQNSGRLTAVNLTLGNGTGTGTYTLNGGTGSASSSLIVGGAGIGTFNINSGGQFSLTSNTFNVGRDAGSNGTVNIDGVGSTLSVKATNPSIGQAGHGEMHLTNGGTLSSTASTLYVGAANGSDGELTIIGSGSLVTGSSGIVVGNAGTGTLAISSGGDLALTGGSTIGSTAGGVGTVTVDGAGSTWSTNGLTVGNSGNGTFSLTNGGQATIANSTNTLTAVVLGSKTGGTGILNVNGIGSQLTSGTMTVGAAGQGTLNINTGGTLNTGNVTIGQTAAAGITSTAVLDGATSSWTAGGVTVGSGHDGELFVTGGATLNSVGGSIGAGTGSGLVEITNSTWNANNPTGTASIGVGSGGVGTLNVVNSTVQTSNRLTVGGSGTSGNGTMLLSNSTFTLLPQSAGVQPNTIEIGRDGGTGLLTVENGSILQANAAQFQLGTRNTLSQGTLIVQDAGTTVTTTGPFTVGQNGAGHLQLLDNAVINAGTLTAAGNGAAITTSDILIDNATLNITGDARLGLGGTIDTVLQNGATLAIGGDITMAENAGSISNLTFSGTGASLTGGGQMIGGKVDVATGEIVAGGTTTINFNQTGTSTLDPALRGFMTVNQNSGLSNLGGDGDYTGDSNINGGVLQATTLQAFSQNSAYHMNGGLLNLNGLDNEIGSLDGTSNVTLGAGTLTTGSLGSTVYDGVISGSGGLTKTGTTIFAMNAAQIYTGETTVDDGELRAGITDLILLSSGLTVNNGALFATNGFNQSIGNLMNDGIVNLFGGGTGTLLNVGGDLSGSGIFGMDTNLAAGTGDHINIAGTSSGAHRIAILNTGGVPASLALSLELVSTTDSNAGGATFSQLGDGVDIGVYSYTVQQGNGSPNLPNTNNWYLALSPTSRSEVAKAIIGTAAVMSNSWFSQMDNLHRRMGKQRLTDPTVHEDEAWVRGYARELDVSASVTGRAFEERLNGIDVGIDRLLSRSANNTWIGGIFGGYGWAERSFNDYGSSGDTKTPYAGIYATWFNANKYYADFTSKLQYFDNSFDAADASGNTHSGAYDQLAYGGSAEFGRRIDLSDDGWIMQPQVQVQYVRLSGDDYTTKLGSPVHVEADNVFQMRAGLEVGRSVPQKIGGIAYPYARVSVINQVSSGGDIEVDTLSFSQDMDGTSIEYGVGMMYQVDDARQGYLSVTRSDGESYDQPWSVNFGFRYEF